MKTPIAIATMALMALTGCQQGYSSSTSTSLPQTTPASLPSPSSASPAAANASPQANGQSPKPLASPAASDLELCKVTQAIVADPNPPLNVRSSPDTEANNVVGTLENGQFVTVIQEQEGWLELTVPVKGWVAKDRTHTSCNQKQQRLLVSAGEQIVIRDRFIGSGSHRYLLSATVGQRLSIAAQGNSLLPAVFAPTDDQQQVDLVGGERNGEQKNWSGEITTTGDYLLRFDSHFRGYTYEISIKLD